VNGLWLSMIGWFLHGAAVNSYQQLAVRQALEGVPVSKLMQTRFVAVPPETPVSTLVNDVFMPSGQQAFPVEREGRLLGLVSLQDLEKREPERWRDTAVGEIMTPAERLVTVSPWQGALEALAMLGRYGKKQLPVVENGMLAGLVRREDVVAWLSLQARGRGRPQLQGAS
jgi:CBS domain-containing protein